MIEVSPEHLKIILDILKRFAPSCEVRAFGSRCKGKAKKYSDLDLAIVGNEKIDLEILADIKEAFEESDLPYRVDVLDWNAISENFRKIINEKYEVIQKAEHNFDDENGLPDGWKTISLGNLVTFQRGHDLSKDKFVNGPYPIVCSNGIIGYHSEYTTTGPGVTIGRSGNVGIPQYIESDFWAHNTSLYVKEFHNSDPKFIYYLLKMLDFSNYNSGTAVPSLNRNFIHPIEVIVPNDINTQKNIASILSSLDDKIELNRKMNEKLEKIAQAIFKQWFIDFEFPDETGKPYKSSGGKMVETEIGEIPSKWNLGTFSNIVQNLKIPLKPGSHLNNRKYVPIECLSMKKIVIECYKEPSEAQSSLVAFEKNDILFGAMRAYFHRVNLAPFSGITRTTTFVLRALKKDFFTYALFLMFQESSVNYANAHSKGTTMPYAVWDGSLSEMATIIPDSSILNKFNEIIIPLLEKINILFFESICLSQIRDLLLPKLMSGKIRVKA